MQLIPFGQELQLESVCTLQCSRSGDGGERLLNLSGLAASTVPTYAGLRLGTLRR